MKYFPAAVLLLCSALTTSFANETALTITPTTMLTGEDQQVLFSIPVDCQTSQCPESVELILWKDKTQQTVKARWAMQESENHIYTQKAFFKETFPATLFFTAAGNSQALLLGQAQLQVIPRPTFLELLRDILQKAFRK